MKSFLQDTPHLLALCLSFALLGLGAMLLREAGAGCTELCVLGSAAESLMTGLALVLVGGFNFAAALRAR